MSLVLHIYVDKDSDVTRQALKAKLAGYEHVQAMENGELQYSNENTGVYCVIGDDAPDKPATRYRSLDMSFVINYLRPNFFGLELFKVIGRLAADNDLLVDVEGEGKPIMCNRDKLYDDWSRVNNNALRTIPKQNGTELEYAYSPRDVCDRRWQFLYHIDEIQERVGDVYVARLFYFKDDAGQLVTAAAWPDCIPILLPPGTDCVILMRNKKKMFKAVTEQLGMVRVRRLLKDFGDSFVRQDDGSYLLGQEQADAIRAEVLAMEVDIPPGILPGEAIAPDMITDTKA